jgi:hypothetical protein
MADSTTAPSWNNVPAKKRGRPRKPPQEGPIIATTIRSQVTRTVTMGAYTERVFTSYIEWASRELHITKQHATTVFLDRAICDLLNRDEVWKKLQRSGRDGDVTDEHAAVQNEIRR